MEETIPTCAFTGHRIEKLPWGENEDDPRCLRLKQELADAAEAVYRGGVRHYLCGMATGCDMYFCETVLALRSEHPDVTIEAAIPWEGQSAGWSGALRRRYDRLVTECDYHTLVCHSYTPDCLMRRNRYMVDNATVLIAAYGGKPGGTMNTLLYAMRQGLEVIQILVPE